MKEIASRLLDNFDRLSEAPDALPRLRQFILDLAVRGKLVEQDPKDEHAIRFDKNIPEDSDALLFSIPPTWTWSRLKELGKLKGGGTPSKAREEFWNGTIPWVSPKDMKVDCIAETQLSITDAAVLGSSVNRIEPRSVLFVVRGMILAHSFPVALSLVPLTINQDMKALVLKQPEMAEYLLRALKGLKPQMLMHVKRSSHGTCRIEGSDYGDFLIPVPPLAEQHRIVAKVDELMALCDRLEAAQNKGAEQEGEAARPAGGSQPEPHQPARPLRRRRGHHRLPRGRPLSPRPPSAANYPPRAHQGPAPNHPQPCRFRETGEAGRRGRTGH